MMHDLANLVVTGRFILSLASRWSSPAYLPSILPAILSILGAGLALFRIGLARRTTVVHRLRVAVDEGAPTSTPRIRSHRDRSERAQVRGGHGWPSASASSGCHSLRA